MKGHGRLRFLPSEFVEGPYHFMDEMHCFDDLYFDCICAFASLDHYPDLGSIIKDLLRIAKNLVVFNESCPSSSLIPPVQHICNLDPHSLVKYFNSTSCFDAKLVNIDDVKYSSLVVIGHKNEKT